MRAPALFLLLVVVAGCGGRAVAPATERHVVRPSPACSSAAPGYRTCFAYLRRAATIERRVGSQWKVVTGPLKHADVASMWGTRAWLSPDRRTLLAEWLYPCDGHIAVFVPATGGKPRIVTGEADWRKAPPTYPLGWTPSGKARVRLLGAWRGISATKHQPVLLFDPKAPTTDAHPAPRGGC